MEIRKITSNETLPIRHAVLWPNKPISFCKVDGDKTAMHYGVYIDNRLVCVASIYLEGNVARLRKFATLGNFQGKGIGSRLIKHILNELQAYDVELFWCDARTTAVGFYKKLGMKRIGSEFLKSNVSYCKMQRFL